jgi:ABC-type spermidine/putrescine transport system permease subunit I
MRKRASASYVASIPTGWLWLLLSPAILIVCFLVIYPVTIAFITSLSGEAGFTLEHYSAFFADPESYASLMRTLGVAVSTTIASIALSLCIAYAGRAWPGWATTLRMLAIIPLGVPVLVAGYSLMLFFAENGLFNNVLVHVLGVLSQPLPISYTMPGLTIACTWRFFPYTALVVMGAMEDLDRSLEDAAAIAGANPIQVFWRVTLPVLAPAIVTGGVLTFVTTFGTFSIPLIMGGGEDLLSVVAYRHISGRFEWAEGSTVVIVMATLQLALLIAFRRSTSHRESSQ